MKKIKALSFAAAAAIALTSCATGTGSDTAAPERSFSADKGVSGDLTVMGFGASDEIATTRLDRFKESAPDVTVSLVEGDLDIQQFLSAVASGEPPELIYASRDQLGTFASRGAIMPLNECIEGEDINTDEFREAAQNQVTFEDTVYGVPEFNQVQITMANADLLDTAGMNVEDVDGSDWDTLTKAAEELSTKSGGSLATLGYDSKLPEFLPLWAKANGADLLSEDGRTANLDDPKVIEALEFGATVYEKQGGFSAVKALRDSADFFGKGNQFATDTLGAMPMEQWYVNILNDVSPEAPMAFTTFKNKDDEPLSFSSGSAWAIPAQSKNAEAACRMIKSMTSVDSWTAAAQARADERASQNKPFTGLFTGNKTADEQIKEKFVKAGDTVWDQAIEASYEANEHGFSLPSNPADAQFKQAWLDAANRVLNKQQEPEESLKQAQKEAQSALDSAWSEWENKQG